MLLEIVSLFRFICMKLIFFKYIKTIEFSQQNIDSIEIDTNISWFMFPNLTLE